MSSPIGGYTKIYNLGDIRVRGLFSWPVSVEEKVDGSQFSFMKDQDGTVHFRSKRVPIFPGNAGMFEKGVASILERADALHVGWVYRGEYLSSPKHNTLAYERTPRGHVILWDVQIARQTYEPYDLVRAEAERLGLEVVPELISQRVIDRDELEALKETTSILGGQKVEGLVIKARGRLNRDGLLLAGKWVSEEFKERNQSSFKGRNPGHKDILARLGEMYRNEARWKKAVQRLRDDGSLSNTPADIGPLMRELNQDLLDEHAPEIKEALFSWAIKTVQRSAADGFPQWYKNELMNLAFEEDEGEQII